MDSKTNGTVIITDDSRTYVSSVTNLASGMSLTMAAACTFKV